MNPRQSTRISPHMARLWQMLNILFTIRSFEVKIAANEEKIRVILEEGAYKLLPTYTQSIRDEYRGAINIWKHRIEEEQIAYNKLLNEMAILSMYENKSSIPELIDKDSDIS